MKTNIITIRPDRLNFKLETLVVGRASSAVATVCGEIPDDIAAMVAVVQYVDGQETKTYKAAATRRDNGTWRIYFAPAYFPNLAEGLRYDIVGTDAEDNPRWLGAGVLRVLENPANGGGAVPEILPPMSYAYNPTTGLYYKLYASVNKYGQVTVDVDQEGVQL